MHYDSQWDAPAWLNRRLGWIVTGVITALLLVVGSSWAWAQTRPEPFRVDTPQIGAAGVAMDRNQVFHIGFDYVKATGKAFQLLDAQAITSTNVEFLGAVAALAQDGATGVGVGPAFPPKEVTATFPIGTTIPETATDYTPPGWAEPARVALIGGFRLTHGEIGGVNGIRVVYAIDGKRHTAIARHAAVVCSNGCRQYLDADDDWAHHALRVLNLLPAED